MLESPYGCDREPVIAGSLSQPSGSGGGVGGAGGLPGPVVPDYDLPCVAGVCVAGADRPESALALLACVLSLRANLRTQRASCSPAVAEVAGPVVAVPRWWVAGLWWLGMPWSGTP